MDLPNRGPVTKHRKEDRLSAARRILHYLKVAIGQLNGIFPIAATTATTTAATATSASFAQAFVHNGFQLSESLLNDGIGSSTALVVRR